MIRQQISIFLKYLHLVVDVKKEEIAEKFFTLKIICQKFFNLLCEGERFAYIIINVKNESLEFKPKKKITTIGQTGQKLHKKVDKSWSFKLTNDIAALNNYKIIDSTIQNMSPLY